jgi:hypothetical protein
MAKDKKQITVVAECTLAPVDGEPEVIRYFDKSWKRLRELAPATLTFNRFVRID